jgi:hypothetical protein
MQASQVHDYASQLLREHGDKAQLIAAQRVLEARSAAIEAKLRIGAAFAIR